MKQFAALTKGANTVTYRNKPQISNSKKFSTLDRYFGRRQTQSPCAPPNLCMWVEMHIGKRSEWWLADAGSCHTELSENFCYRVRVAPGE